MYIKYKTQIAATNTVCMETNSGRIFDTDLAVKVSISKASGKPSGIAIYLNNGLKNSAGVQKSVNLIFLLFVYI